MAWGVWSAVATVHEQAVLVVALGVWSAVAPGRRCLAWR